MFVSKCFSVPSNTILKHNFQKLSMAWLGRNLFTKLPCVVDLKWFWVTLWYAMITTWMWLSVRISLCINWAFISSRSKRNGANQLGSHAQLIVGQRLIQAVVKRTNLCSEGLYVNSSLSQWLLTWKIIILSRQIRRSDPQATPGLISLASLLAKEFWKLSHSLPREVQFTCSTRAWT